jgi:ribonuclease HI
LLDPRAIHIYTDGSCYKNPGGESGCAAMVHFPDHLGMPDEQILDFGCGESSINRMELMACVEALRWAFRNAPWAEVTRVLIVTDSQYITQNLVRAPSWKKRGWRNLSGEPKFNDELWDKLLKARAKVARVGLRVDFVWQVGKKTALAKQVDKAAKIAARRGGIDIDAGYKPGAVGRSMISGGVAQRFPAAAQVLVVRPYVKKVMRKGEDRISFNIFDEATQTYFGKFYAFAAQLLSTELHRGSGHRVRFGSDPKYPQFVERIEGVPLPSSPSKRTRIAQP